MTWISDEDGSDDWGVYAQRYDSSGTALGGETLVNTATAGDQIVPNVAVAALSDGGYIVTWMSADLPGTDRFDIHAQRYDGSGSALGSEILVNVTG